MNTTGNKMAKTAREAKNEVIHENVARLILGDRERRRREKWKDAISVTGPYPKSRKGEATRTPEDLTKRKCNSVKTPTSVKKKGRR